MAGNRLSETIDDVPTSYTYNRINQLVSDGTNTLAYDPNGNMTSDGVNSYAWDHANRLLSMGGVDYNYDGWGNRIAQDNGVDVTKYLLDLQPGLAVVLRESDGTNTRCIVPEYNGTITAIQKEHLWDKYFMEAPERQRQSVAQYKTVKRA